MVSAMCVGASGDALEATDAGASCSSGTARIACMAQ
jgi:hypothetical protein